MNSPKPLAITANTPFGSTIMQRWRNKHLRAHALASSDQKSSIPCSWRLALLYLPTYSPWKSPIEML